MTLEETSSNNDDNPSVLIKEEFSRQVEQIVLRSNGNISFIDAVISLADIHDIDLSGIKKLLTPSIIEQIMHNAKRENMVRKISQNEVFKTKDKQIQSLNIFM